MTQRVERHQPELCFTPSRRGRRLDPDLCTVYGLCMATKTISLTVEAYERLRAARRRPDESFTEVVLRAEWPDRSCTAAELLHRLRTEPPVFSEDELDRIDRALAEDRPPEDPWKER